MKIFNAVKSVFCVVLIVIISFMVSSCDFKSTLDNGKDIWDNVVDKGDDLWDDVVDKGEDLWDDVVDKGEDIISDAKDIFNVSKEKLIELYGTAKEGATYVYNEAAELTVNAYNKASAKANELIGDAKEYIAGLGKVETPQIIFAQSNKDYPMKDLATNLSFNEKDAITVDKNYLTEKFVTYYISSILAARGYTVYNGAVYYKENIYGGIIFTKEEVFIDEGENKVYSCGFVQLVSDNYSGVKITEKMVQSGLIAVSTSSYGNEVKSFIVDEYAIFDDFSGIYNNVYFKYTQIDDYVLSVSLKDNNKANYDSNVELYDFDNEKTIYSTNTSNEVYDLYTSNPNSFTGASATVNAIAELEESSDGELSTVFVLEGGTLNKIIEKASTSASKVEDFVASSSKGVSLEGNQFLKLDENGQSQVLGTENNVDKDRVTNGLISSIGSGLATAGAVASIVCTYQAGAFMISAIVITAGTSAIVYNVSNMLAGVQDIYYGAKGSLSESLNPVLEMFKKLIPDEKVANLVYHIWGAGSTILSNIMMPVSKALNIAKVKGLNIFQTAASVIRASVVTVAKALATGIGAGIVGNYVSKVVTKVSNDQNLGKLVGFGASLVSGMLIYKGLDLIDQKLDISGLYPKSSVKKSFQSDFDEQANSLYKKNASQRTRGEDEEIANRIADMAAKQYGLQEKPTIRVVYDSSNSTSGYYNPNNNSITVNMRSSDNYYNKGLADTIGHEMRHAWQQEYAYYNPNSEMADSLNNYISPNSDFSNYNSYRYQLCEADAWDAGAKFANWFMALFG